MHPPILTVATSPLRTHSYAVLRPTFRIFASSSTVIVMTVGFTLSEMHRRVEARQFYPLAKVSKPDVAASYALDQAIKAAVHVLEAMRPADAPGAEETHPELYPSWSARFANDVIRAVRGDV